MSAWGKLPVAAQAILQGLAVLLVGIVPWSVLAAANLKTGAEFPWAFFVGLAYLILYWRYLSGWGLPRATAVARRKFLRGAAVPRRVLFWAGVAGTLLAGTLIGLQIVGWTLGSASAARLQEFAELRTYAGTTVLPMLMMAALFAGVTEEAGFRGYMQVPIEERYGPAVGIGVPAFVFAVAHFSPAAFPGLFLGGVGWGLLAYLSGSILPGIVFHALVNATVWLWLWSSPDSVQVIAAYQAAPDSGNAAFVVASGSTTLLAAGAVAAFWKLASVKPGAERTQR